MKLVAKKLLDLQTLLPDIVIFFRHHFVLKQACMIVVAMLKTCYCF